MLVGDTLVGKSALIRNFLENIFDDNCEPTILDVYRGIKKVDETQVELEIHDTSGDVLLGYSRTVQYQDADCFMICVACNSPES